MTTPIKGFVELRGLDRFEFDGMDLGCLRCDTGIGTYFDEGFGVSLLQVVVDATDHLAECTGGDG